MMIIMSEHRVSSWCG